MARAKRTDRAEARRRYRETVSEDLVIDGEATDSADTSSASSTVRPAAKRGVPPPRPGASRAGGSDGPALPPVGRPSFTAAFRAAARPLNVRSDIAYIPTLVLRTRAVWIPSAAAIGAGVLFLASQPLGSNQLANLALQLFVLPPTIAGSFLAGVLAPRATYIAGGIAALVGALVFSAAVLVTPSNLSAATIAPTPSPAASALAGASASPGPSASPAASPTTGSTAQTDALKASEIVQAIVLSVPFGIGVGAFGGYYRRFLAVSSPNRQRRIVEQRRKTSRPKQPGRRF